MKEAKQNTGPNAEKLTDAEEEKVGSPSAQPSDEPVNQNLDDVLDLMLAEVERLKASLEFVRMMDVEDKQQRIRWHVIEIDRRQDRIEELKALLLDRGDFEH